MLKYRVTLFYLLAAALLLGAALYIPYDDPIVTGHPVADPAATSLQLVSEIAKLVMTLNTAMLAGAGALLAKRYSWVRLGGIDKSLVMGVFLCGAISYFGVYFSQTRILTMTGAGILDPLELGLLWGIRLQYGGLILGVLLLGLVFSRAVDADHGSDDGAGGAPDR